MVPKLSGWARAIKRDVVALYLCARDPRTPWYAKLLAFAVAGYALSPIDLIPDFIPIIGYLDDLILVPLGIIVAIRMIPPEVLSEHRLAAERMTERPVSWAAAAVIMVFWIAGTAGVGWLLYRYAASN